MKTTFVALLALVSATAMSQSRSSFHNVASITGVSVTSSNAGKSWTVGLGSSPTVVSLGQTYQVTDLFGFWLLDNDDDLGAAAGNQNGWAFNDNYSGSGGIAGWKTNPNRGLTPGSTPLTFTFGTLVGQKEQVGYHMRFDRNFASTGGNTAYVTAAPVPEPGTLTVLFGATALLARRKRRRA